MQREKGEMATETAAEIGLAAVGNEAKCSR